MSHIVTVLNVQSVMYNVNKLASSYLKQNFEFKQ